MQLPKRKPGKYTNEKADLYVTAAKFDELKNELVGLKVSQMPAAKELQRLAEMGDFSENAAYQMAKGRLRAINQKITELENYINHAILIEPDSDSSRVQLGSNVTIVANGIQRTYLILGSTEANPDKNIISHQSPIGSLLMGKKTGDIVQLKLQDRIIEYQIVSIE